MRYVERASTGDGICPGGGDLWWVVGTGLAAAALYLSTSAPAVSFGGDCGELSAAAAVLGVPHPTGYPLYMLLARAAIALVPVGTVAWRVTLVSAVAGGVAVALVARMTLRLTGDRAAALCAAMALACAGAFWSQAVLAEVYTLHIALLAALATCLIEWSAGGDERWLMAAGVCFGLGLAHHLSILLCLPAVALFIALTLRGEQRARRSATALARFALWATPGLLLYVYLPLRALRQPPILWGDPTHLDGFLAHLTGRAYTDLVGVGGGEAVRYVRNHLLLLALDLRYALLLAVLGAALAPRTQRPAVALWAVLAAAAYGFAAGYRVGDRANYVLPAYLAAAALAGLGAAVFREWLGKRAGDGAVLLPVLSGVLVVLLPCLPSPPDGGAAARAAYDRASLAGNRRAEVLARAVLAEPPPRAALLVASDELAFACWYEQIVGGFRRDLTVHALGSTSTTRGAARYHRVLAAELPVRPVSLAFVDQELAAAGRLEAKLGTCRVLPAGARPPIEVAFGAAGGERLPGVPGWRLVGARVDSPVSLADAAGERLPALKPRTVGRLTATFAADRVGSEPLDLAVVMMHWTVAAAAGGDREPSGVRVINDSSGAVRDWWVERRPFAAGHGYAPEAGTAVTERHPIGLPERVLAGEYVVRVGLLPAGDESAWAAIERDPSASWRVSVPAGRVVSYER